MKKSSPFLISGPVGQLECQLELPEQDRTSSIAVVLHPHPLHGGAMGNKVVVTLARALTEAGIPALRFNFRGVGNSEGKHDNGIGEQQDAAAAVAWLHENYPNRQLILAGFSFGAATAVRCAKSLQATQLISCAAPASYFSNEAPEVDCDWLAIHGEADEVASWPDAKLWLESQSPAPEIVSKAGVGHFFHGELSWLRETVAERLPK